MKNAPHKSASAYQRRGSRPAGARRPAGADDSIVNLRGSFPAAAVRSGVRIVRAIDDGYTAAPGNWAPANRPVRRPGGVYTRVEVRHEVRKKVRRMVTADLISQGAGQGWRGVPGADRAAPAGAAGALLPDARLFPGRRGRPPGHAAGRLARPRRVRGTCLAAHLAVPDRHQPVPQRASRGQPAPGQGMGHVRDANRPSRLGSARPSGCSRIPTPSWRVRSACRPGRRPTTSRPNPSRWRS